ncbi:right-handed parallel beta-helix repeat-containing protein [Celeribacter halophilus]|uniref:right-handed parallel beta-helix repeat-containing protein n=1 Tax=Celeribacter halophilus TaxID=576117 RepID=UPI003A92A28D
MADLHVYANDTPENGYGSIQDAIDASTEGDTIIVHSGTYSENLVQRENNINLVSLDGPDSTTIIPEDSSLDTIRVSGADAITIEGFTIEGSSDSTRQAVHVHAADGGSDFARDIVISGNVILRGAGDGIKLSKVSDVLIEGNTINGGGTQESGIDLVGGERIVLTGNLLSDMGHIGISLKGGSRDLIVSDNVIDGAAHTGIEIGGYTNLNNYMPGFLDSGEVYEISNVMVSDNEVIDASGGAYRVIGGQNIAFVDNSAAGEGAVVKVDDSSLYHDIWYSDDISFLGNAFSESNWLIDRSIDATISFDGAAVFTPWLGNVPVATLTEVSGASNGGDAETGAPEDLIYGLTGDDKIENGDGSDTVYGGDGEDEIYGNDGNDILYGEAGEDRLEGGAGHDILIGGSENDRLHGGDGNDTLIAGSGDDRLEGDDGDDLLYAGSGDADLEGGSGADSFVFSYEALLETVRVRDFSLGEDDQLIFEGFGTDFDAFSDLDSNGNGILDKADAGIDVSGDRTDIDFGKIFGEDILDMHFRLDGSSLTVECFDFV